MSLCDVIFHTCSSFKEQSFELAYNVIPILVQYFNLTNEDQINSIFSLLGKATSAVLTVVECLLSVVSVLKSKIEPFAKELI